MRLFLFSLMIAASGFAEERVAVLSYFRCGTHLFNYCLTQLTGRSWEKTVLNGYCCRVRDPENACPEKTPFIHQHSHVNLRKLDPKKDKLIFLLRNNKELLIRRFGPEKFDGLFGCIVRDTKGYYEAATYYKNIIKYDTWPAENRILVYYKDLIENPEDVFEKVLTFLGEEFDRWDDFFDNFEEHRKFSHQNRGGATGGKLVHFTEMVPREKLIAYDKKVKETYPKLYEKYLKCFETR